MFVTPILRGESLFVYVVGAAWQHFALAFPRTARAIAFTTKTTVIVGATIALAIGLWFGSMHLKAHGINVSAAWNGQPPRVESTQAYQACVAGIEVRQAKDLATKVLWDALVLSNVSAKEREQFNATIGKDLGPESHEVEVDLCRDNAIETWMDAPRAVAKATEVNR